MMYHDSTPILTLSYSICFYLIFLSVPHLAVLLLKKLKVFKEIGLKALLREILDLQVIFLFCFILIPGLILLLISIIFRQFLGGLNLFILFLEMLPVVIIYVFFNPLWSLGFLMQSIPASLFPLFGLVLVYIWFRMSYDSIKKHLKLKTKEVWFFLVGFVLIILLFNLIGQSILNNLHYQYYYCPQNILCPR